MRYVFIGCALAVLLSGCGSADEVGYGRCCILANEDYCQIIEKHDGGCIQACVVFHGVDAQISTPPGCR